MIKYFDLFTGIGAGSLAINSVFSDSQCVGFSEIDKYAEAVYKFHFPQHLNFGDISKIDINSLPDFDLLIGGSPCQDLSVAKQNRQGLDGARSSLFFKYVEIRNIKKPKYFILENVASMRKEDKDKMSAILGLEPTLINSALVSAQSRKRLFWVGKLVDGAYQKVEISQPEDKGILLKDILLDGTVGRDKDYYIDACYYKSANWNQYQTKGGQRLVQKVGYLNKGGQGDRIYSPDGKSVTLSANGGGRGAKTGLYLVAPNGKKIILGNSNIQVLKEGRTEEGKQSRKNIRDQTGKDSTLRGKDHKAYFGKDGNKSNCLTTGLGVEGLVIQKEDDSMIVRKLTPIECERLQTYPDNYTAQGLFNGEIKPISNTQRYRQLGNSFTVEVIKHILQQL